jgi:hypothetical protein
MSIHKTRPAHFPVVDTSGFKYKPEPIVAFVDMSYGFNLNPVELGWHEYHAIDGISNWWHFNRNLDIDNDTGPAVIMGDGSYVFYIDGNNIGDPEEYWKRMYIKHRYNPEKLRYVMSAMLGKK